MDLLYLRLCWSVHSFLGCEISLPTVASLCYQVMRNKKCHSSQYKRQIPRYVSMENEGTAIDKENVRIQSSSVGARVAREWSGARVFVCHVQNLRFASWD